MEKSTREEFLETVCNIYMIFMLMVLPLYTNGTYYLLGDTKYDMFRSVSFICLGIWCVMGGIFALRKSCSIVDICVLCYGAANVISALCSSFGNTPWLGYRDWYMGAVSQLLFVAIYFMVSRHYTQNALIIYLGEAALLAVTLIGLLNRLGVDLLGLYEGFQTTDWEYSHMLSTLGNINWLCGYYSVLLALPIAGYLYSSRRWKVIFLYITSLLGLTLLCIQGSDSGPVIALVGLGIGALFCVNHEERFRKVFFLITGVVIMLPVMGALITLFQAQAATPIDGDMYAKMCWKGWWLIAAVLGVICVLLCRVSNMVQRRLAKTIVILGAISLGVIGCLILVKWQGNPAGSWGSGRGMLWSMAKDAFVQGDWKQKLIGAGPDCYADYLISQGGNPAIDTEGRWNGAIYVNAHNEWLTHLVNLGLLGTTAYLGIFVSAAKRYRGMLLGVLALGMYGVHSLVSFQQVLNTPFLFLVLGLCESRCRKAEMPGDV